MGLLKGSSTLIELHKITIEDEPLNAKYAYRAQCKCGWASRQYTAKDAEDAGSRHLTHQGILAESGGIRAGS